MIHILENIAFTLLTDGTAHLLSSCLSVRVTVEKCSVRTAGEDFLATKGE